MTAGAAYTCILCGRTTRHPDDVANAYCPCCGSDAVTLPKDCEHRAEMRTMSDREVAVFYLAEGYVLGARARGIDLALDDVRAQLAAGTPEDPGIARLERLVERKIAAARRRT